MERYEGRLRMRRLGLLIVMVLIVLIGVSIALAFAEEPLSFRDPYSGQITTEEVSSIHYDLTYAMALAAGFSISDSMKLQLWNQLVDSEVLGTGQPVTYTNCSGTFYPTPDPNSVCSPGTDTSKVSWPLWDSMKDSSSCVISRFGPYSPFFHFPHQNDQEPGALHDWGWGITNTLVGYEAYAWGGPTVLTSDCVYTRTVEITTSIQAGSLEAFATYLHSLGDSYSHRDCLAALEGVSPWGTHTLIGTEACDYIPTNPNNRDAHGREFGTQSMTDSLRTDEGVLAIYSELTARSLQGEGIYPPLGLDDSLPGVDGALTLREALYYFIHTWEFEPVKPGDPEFAENRRNYAAMIATAALAQRHKLHLPMVIR